MAELKTRVNDASVTEFLAGVADEAKRKDCKVLVRIMKQATGARPRMWGSSIVGFGSYHYRYASGREGDCPLVGFSPRRQDLTLYIMAGFRRYDGLMKKLGKHRTGRSCLYVKRLSDVDLAVLTELIQLSVDHMRWAYP